MKRVKKWLSVASVITLMALGFMSVTPIEKASAGPMDWFSTSRGTVTVGRVYVGGDTKITINGVQRYYIPTNQPVSPANAHALQVRLCASSCTSWKSFTDYYYWANATFTRMKPAYYNVQITDSWSNYYFIFRTPYNWYVSDV